MNPKVKALLIALAGVAVVGAVGYGLNAKYHWYPKTPAKPDDVVPTPAPAAASARPRGKLPWSIGDVGLWDDEEPTYCSKCKDICNTSYSDGYSTQCDECQSKCH